MIFFYSLFLDIVNYSSMHRFLLIINQMTELSNHVVRLNLPRSSIQLQCPALLKKNNNNNKNK